MKVRIILGLILFYGPLACTIPGEEDKMPVEKKLSKDQWEANYTYSGDSLRNIAFPVGGIGTGNALLGGRGNILEWEIFGKANRDELPPYMTFFAIHAKSPEGKRFNRIMEGEYLSNFPNPFGVPRQQLSGMQRFRTVRA